MKTKFDNASLKFITEHLWMNLEQGEFVELRAIGSKGDVMHGAYTQPEALVKMAKHLSGEMNVYFGLNPRKMNSRHKETPLNEGVIIGKSYGAGSISRICHLLVDFDRKTKFKDENGNVLPASEEELKGIKEVVDDVSSFLNSRVIDHAIFCSGNGYHILIHTSDYDVIETPPKFKKVLDVLNAWFGNDNVEIDSSTYDSPRICKLYGTKSLKGDSRNFKKNRNSIYESGALSRVDVLEKLKDVISYQMQPVPQISYGSKTYDGQHLPIVDIFKRHNLYEKFLSRGRHIVNCPWRANHGSNTDATSTTVIFDGSEDRFGFKCFHNSCRNKSTLDVLGYLQEKGRDTGSMSHITTLARFSFKSLGEVLDEQEAEQEWLVDQVLMKGGTSILAGRPKSGKTTLARDLAYCISHGKRWLNLQTQEGIVLFVALEDKSSQLKRIFKKLDSNAKAPIFFHVGRPPAFPLPPLKEEIIKRKASLVIIDTMLKFQHLNDVSDYSETNKFLYELSIIARETDCHILVLHHSGKGGEASESDDERSLLGSTAISGAADTLMFVTQKNGLRCFSTVQRYGEGIEKCVLELDEDTGRMSTHSLGTYRINESRERILELLRDGAKERQFLASSLKMKGQDFTNVLKDMVQQNLIKRHKEGKRDIYEAIVEIDSSPIGEERGIDEIY